MSKLERYRKVMFTDAQMLIARNSGKFQSPPSTPMLEQHRPFIEWLFRKQHRVTVVDHTKLKYEYLSRNKVCVVIVEGTIGSALQFL